MVISLDTERVFTIVGENILLPVMEVLISTAIVDLACSKKLID